MLCKLYLNKLFTKIVLRQWGIRIFFNENLTRPHRIHIKNNSTWIIGINLKSQTITYLGNTEE